MEVNKDEALRCIQISKGHFNDGNYEKALKFAKKSLSLYETPQGQQWLKELQENKGNSGSTANSSEGIRNRKKPKPTTREDSQPGLQNKTYTKEQLAEVEKIKNCKDYYELFSISKDASDADLKKAYRKLALKFHPDKNSAPGADEAFKVIGHAFAVLSDPDKRRQYDQLGPEMENMHRVPTGSPYGGGYGRQTYYYENEMTPEEIFRMMFGDFVFSDIPRNQQFFYQRQPRAQRRQQQQDSGRNSLLYTFLQIVPLLLLLLISISSFTSPKYPKYSFNPSRQYSQEAKTYQHNIPYYYNPSDYSFNNQKQFKKFEDSIEEEYFNDLIRKCELEKRRKMAKINNARGFFSYNKEAYEKAQKMRLYNCEKLHEYNYNYY
ncbi:DnaJ-domain-containing protein [Neocallimastix lanati (nom. inval.)]|jgi:DnaJ family protein B protein 12|uniref:DnaJ-domain-containing protein n=1 Tax=Neocallimastix californiae TaxID=1754190 RepID=A0A1Y2AS96_9FUNG|nr:DnaJ-domain-containing protein [Neocallimastix sp. JGI-2020a]ORY25412.1 DnaJ-domain-containing protein [Neocallimastix californiae]|eukprot:ORY25412.1 DnaJ-domain-containing protein [Neocallimastix californiae]